MLRDIVATAHEYLGEGTLREIASAIEVRESVKVTRKG